MTGTGNGILLAAGDPLAAALDAIHAGDVARLEALLRENPGVCSRLAERGAR